MNPEIYKREDILFQGQQRAPATIFGIINGGVLGALFDGPRGAIIGSMLGGSIGYAIDSKQRTAPHNHSLENTRSAEFIKTPRRPNFYTGSELKASKQRDQRTREITI